MRKLITILLFIISIPTFSQVWLTEKVEVKLDKHFKFGMKYEDRLYDCRLKYEHTDISLSYLLTKNLTLSLNLRGIREFDTTYISQEYRPHFSLDYKYHKFGIRPRFEIRFIEDEHSFRFRNKIYFVQPLYKKVNLYLADEIFVTDKLSGNRVYCGLLIKYKVADFLFYYLRSSKNKEYWIKEHITGLSTRLSF